MGDKQMVSVLIPTYHSTDTLLRAIDSVLAQTYPWKEVIVVDDNDPDSVFRKNTEQLMQRYQDNESVIYIQHERNKNGAAARNTGFLHSKGDYITFLDDDDFYYPQKLEKQVQYLQSHPSCMGCYCWRQVRGKEICGTYSGDLTNQILSLEFTPCTDALMIRREVYEALNGFDESYYRHQDFEFMLRYFEKYTMDFVPSVQFETGTNGVDNTPRGKKLVALKEMFFTQFQDKIQQICETDEAMGQKLYRNHFVPTVKDLVRDGHLILAVQVYWNYGRQGEPGFWRQLCSSLVRAASKRIDRLKIKSNNEK